MREVSQRLLEKASRAIAAAERERKSGEAEFAVARAYYAMFYTAEALLSEKGLRFRKHGGVHGAFGEHFAKTGTLDPKYHRWLLAAVDQPRPGISASRSAISQPPALERIPRATSQRDR